MVKMLFGIMHPRRLDYFLGSMRQLDYIDVLLAKNMEILTATKTLRDYFLENDYDYLLLTSDDVVIPYLAPLTLMRDIEKEGYDVLTGWSRRYPDSPDVNINAAPIPNVQLKEGRSIDADEYGFYQVKDLMRLFNSGVRYVSVWFLGFSLTAMSRKVVGEWTPAGWNFSETSPFKPLTLADGRRGYWCATDLWFSYQTSQLGFQKYADLPVYVPHYPNLHELLVGMEKPEVTFIRARKDPEKIQLKQAHGFLADPELSRHPLSPPSREEIRRQKERLEKLEKFRVSV